MLKNTKELLEIAPNTFKKVEYVFLIIGSKEINKIDVYAAFYSDAENFYNNVPEGSFYIGEFEGNINEAGTLGAAEDYALTKLTDFEKCPTLFPRITVVDVPLGETITPVDNV